MHMRRGFVSGFSLGSWGMSHFTWQKPGAGDSSAVRLDVSAVPSCREGQEDSWRAPGLHPYWKAEETRLYCQCRLAAVAAARCQQCRWTDQTVWRQTGKSRSLTFTNLCYFRLSQGQVIMFTMHLSASIKLLIICVPGCLFVGFTSGQVDQPKWTITPCNSQFEMEFSSSSCFYLPIYFLRN